MLVVQGLAQGQEHFVVIPGFADVAMDLPLINGFDDRRGVCITGEHDPRGRRIVLTDMGQQRGAVHIGHAGIAHHQVHRLRCHDFQRLGTAGGQQHLIGLAAQQATQTVEDRLLIIDQQQFGAIVQHRYGWVFHGMGLKRVIDSDRQRGSTVFPAYA
ncbi:hypothetical protein D3C84_762370 [compost metagenome]